MSFKTDLQEAIKGVLVELGLPEVEPQLEHPDNPEHGDYATNIAMAIFKKVAKVDKQSLALRAESSGKVDEVESKFKTPLELAEEIKKKLDIGHLSLDILDRVEVISPGFINFWLSKDALSRELSLAIKSGERYTSSTLRTSLKGQKLIVEFAHPNTHKEFHIGHLRNIMLGECFSRLFEFLGAKVIRANYQGDVGLHIAKAIWGVKKLGMETESRKSDAQKAEFLAKAYVLGNTAYNEGTEAKSEIEDINKKLYEADPELTKLWQETRAWSLIYFDSIYKRLGTKFDRLYFESEVAKSGLDIVSKNLDTVFEKSDGAVIYPGERYGLHNRVFINSLGLPTYEAKDIGLAQLQFSEFNPNKIIHVVGPEQSDYFKVVFSALEKALPESIGKEFHLPYGWVRLKTGKMSSRTGEVVAAVWLLDEIKKRLGENYDMEESIAEMVAAGAVKYSMLRFHPRSEIAFDIDESIRLDGESGPYLQYTFARCRSVLRKAGKSNWANLTNLSNLQSEELALLRTFYKFPEVVEAAAAQYAPNLLCNFLYDLGSKYNLLYNNLAILEPEGDGDTQHVTRNTRLALTAATGQILKTGLNLLGISAPERM